MKYRILSVLALAGMLFSSCVKETLTAEGGSILAIMENDDTRTSVTDEGKFTWSEGDQVWLHTTSGSIVGTLSSGAGTASANFSFGAYFGEMTGRAVYPYNDEHSISGDVLSIAMPSSYDLGSNLTNTNAAMYGEVSDGRLKFNHMAGVMRFKFKNVPAGVNKFTITLDKKISGTFTADLTEVFPVIEAEETYVVSEKTITLNFNALTEASELSLYVPLPLGTYNSLDLALYAGTNSVWTYSKTVTNTINRKSLKLMPTITLGGTIGGDIESGETGEEELEPEPAPELFAGLYGEYPELFNDASYYGCPAKGTLVIAASDDPAHHLKMTFFSGTRYVATTYADVSSDGKYITTVQPSGYNTYMGTFYSSTLEVNTDGGTVTIWGTLKFDWPTITDYVASNDLSAIPYATDLSSSGTANSYIVSKSGAYKFSAVKGNSSESVGSVSSAVVLWESFGTNVTPSVGDLVKNVVCSDDYITFRTADKFKEGNAVIAAKDASGTILWSWHIWFTDQPHKQVYYNNAGTMMDRNLGATSATPGDVGALGLLYQWGRKDPFLGSSSILSDQVAESTITWPSAVSSDSNYGTLDYTTSNPMTFVTQNTSNHDWYYTGDDSTDNTRWTTSETTKSIYDPCPAGWRVPGCGAPTVWSSAGFKGTTYDSANMGISFSINSPSTTWYPASGLRSLNDGGLSFAGVIGGYWSASPNVYSYNVLNLYFNNTDYVDPAVSDWRAYGRSVRCVQDAPSTVTPSEPKVPVVSANLVGTWHSNFTAGSGYENDLMTIELSDDASKGQLKVKMFAYESYGSAYQLVCYANLSEDGTTLTVLSSGVDYTGMGTFGENMVMTVSEGGNKIEFNKTLNTSYYMPVGMLTATKISPYAYLFGELTESFDDASYYGYPAKGKLVIAASDDPAHHLKMIFFSGRSCAATTYADVSSDGKYITTVQPSGCTYMGTFYSSTLEVNTDGGTVTIWGTLKFDWPTISDYAASK